MYKDVFPFPSLLHHDLREHPQTFSFRLLPLFLLLYLIPLRSALDLVPRSNRSFNEQETEA